MKKLIVGAAAAITFALGDGRACAGNAAAPGYMIANYTITDQAGYQKYMEAAAPLAPQYGGKIIVFNLNATAVEGSRSRSWPSPSFRASPTPSGSTIHRNIPTRGSSAPLRPKARS